MNNWDFPTRLWNSISPIQFSGKDTETRRLFRESGFDLTTTMTTASNGVSLNGPQRSRLAQLMGDQNLEADLETLYRDPAIRDEIAFYQNLRAQGITGNSPENRDNVPYEKSRVYRLTQRLFNRAKTVAMQGLYTEFPELLEQGRRRQVIERAQGRGDSDLVQEILNLPK